MVRKTYSAPKLLAQVKHHGFKSKSSLKFDKLAAQVCGPSTFEALFDSNHVNRRADDLEKFWAALARRALTLGNDDDQADREMRRTFEHFKLDHRNPWAWRLLIIYFSHVLFSEKRRRGGTKTWNGERIMELRREMIKWKLQKHPATSVAKKLRANTASSFHRESYEQLRIYVGKLRASEKQVSGSADV